MRRKYYMRRGLYMGFNTSVQQFVERLNDLKRYQQLRGLYMGFNTSVEQFVERLNDLNHYLLCYIH
jgi:hypothetical protein